MQSTGFWLKRFQRRTLGSWSVIRVQNLEWSTVAESLWKLKKEKRSKSISFCLLWPLILQYVLATSFEEPKITQFGPHWFLHQTFLTKYFNILCTNWTIFSNMQQTTFISCLLPLALNHGLNSCCMSQNGLIFNLVAHKVIQTNHSSNCEEISYLHLFQRSRPPSSQVQTCYLCRALFIFAYIVLNIFVLCSIHICCPNTCAFPPSLGHSPLGQELSWKTEIWQPRIFQAGNIPNRETRTAKTNLTGKETEIALIS